METITIEVTKSVFLNTNRPFLVGDWLTAEKVDTMENDGIYYIKEKEQKNGYFSTYEANFKPKGNEVFRVKTIARNI